jgi:hypothetical protein
MIKMKKQIGFLLGVVAMAVFMAFGALTFFGPDTVLANHLAAPTGVVCPLTATDALVDWDDLANATKYSVNVQASYDTDGDAVDDTFISYDFGTSDRTDGDPIITSDLDIPLSSLDALLDPDGDTVFTLFSPTNIDVRVKGLHSGNGQGKQNNPFSDPLVTCV